MADLVTITVDGELYQMAPGWISFQDLLSQTDSDDANIGFTVVSTPSQPSKIGGNDSYNIRGGEVFQSDNE